MQIIEPLRQEKKLTAYLDENVKKVGIVFYHGLGDGIQFIAPFNRLKELYPKIHFDIMLQKGLDQKVIYPDAVEFDSLDKVKVMTEYDYIFLVHFPVEQDPNLTKSELCGKLELGLPDKFERYGDIPEYPLGCSNSPCKKLIGIHYQNTALPDVFNPDEKTAEKIWNEVLNEGFIPIELTFRHGYHNPKNTKFSFIDCTVRNVKPTVTTLLELIKSCKAVIAVPSGPLHCALAIMPERVLYMEKSVSIERFYTKIKIHSIDVRNYKDNDVKNWLNNVLLT